MNIFLSLLFWTAPVIYVLVIGFSIWLGLQMGQIGRRRNFQPILAILAGLISCPLTAILIQLGQYKIPSIPIGLSVICITIIVGLGVGFAYLWIAKSLLGNWITGNLFILGSVIGSSVSLYFYFFHTEVKDILISSAWGFLFGVLVYAVLDKASNTSTQGIFGDLVNRTRR